MAPRFLTILTGRNLPKIRQPRAPEPSNTCAVLEPPADKFALLQSDFAREVFCYSGSLRMIGRIDDGLVFPAIVRRACNITTGVFGTSNSMASHGLMRRGSFV